MSVITTQGVQFSPSGASTQALDDGGLAWVFGPKVVFIASAAAGTALAAFTLGEGGSWFAVQGEIGVFLGGATTPAGVLGFYAPTSGNGGPAICRLLVPMGDIPVGTSVSLALRRKTPSVSLPVALHYYEGFDATLTLPNPTCAPLGADMVVLTPPGVAWQNTAWVELLGAQGHAVALAGLAITNPIRNIEVAYDLGLGPDSGSVTFITTLIASFLGTDAGKISHVLLGALYPVDPDDHVFVRFRIDSTSTTLCAAKLLYYDTDVVPPPPLPAGCPTALPLTVVTGSSGCAAGL